nr:hypothetical protein [Tanacetum cinerariifolium]
MRRLEATGTYTDAFLQFKSAGASGSGGCGDDEESVDDQEDEDVDGDGDRFGESYKDMGHENSSVSGVVIGYTQLKDAIDTIIIDPHVLTFASRDRRERWKPHLVIIIVMVGYCQHGPQPAQVCPRMNARSIAYTKRTIPGDMSPRNVCHRGTDYLTEKYVGPTFSLEIVAVEGIPVEHSPANISQRQVTGETFLRRQVAWESPKMSLGNVVNVVVNLILAGRCSSLNMNLTIHVESL